MTSDLTIQAPLPDDFAALGAPPLQTPQEKNEKIRKNIQTAALTIYEQQEELEKLQSGNQELLNRLKTSKIPCKKIEDVVQSTAESAEKIAEIYKNFKKAIYKIDQYDRMQGESSSVGAIIEFFQTSESERKEIDASSEQTSKLISEEGISEKRAELHDEFFHLGFKQADAKKILESQQTQLKERVQQLQKCKDLAKPVVALTVAAAGIALAYSKTTTS